jgi:hypothetical protein
VILYLILTTNQSDLPITSKSTNTIIHLIEFTQALPELPMTPLGWTRQSNIEGFLAGTYDVISFWRRGPDVEKMSDVPVFIEPATNQRILGWTRQSNYMRYLTGEDDVIACWPEKPNEPCITLYIKDYK